ncbi:DUF1634 domain-containing protein [Solitalea koreensis]|nr:DUF1634 domain-containing protein [Solitalea koreensis]
MLRNLRNNDIEVSIASLLVIGVLLSIIVVVFGGGIYLIRHASNTVDYATFNSSKALYTDIYKIIKGILNFKGQAVIQLGVLILICTPIARVVFSIIGFVLERDTLYTIIALFVLIIIACSVMLGYAG